MKQEKLEEAVMECYKEMYLASEPSVDFDHLMDVAELDEQGRKIIKYLDYKINKLDYDRILEEICKKYKIKGALKKGFEIHIALGVSPTFKQDGEM